MIPGMNPKAMKQAMKKMGMKQEDIAATEVIIRTVNGDLIIRNPQVAKVTMMGQESFQISGQVDILKALVISEEDISTVMDQTSCSHDKAKAALEKTEGDLATAILDLQE
jgi:nascent polypeptide-associated complex subunit alpha